MNNDKSKTKEAGGEDRSWAGASLKVAAGSSKLVAPPATRLNWRDLGYINSIQTDAANRANLGKWQGASPKTLPLLKRVLNQIVLSEVRKTAGNGDTYNLGRDFDIKPHS